MIPFLEESVSIKLKKKKKSTFFTTVECQLPTRNDVELGLVNPIIIHLVPICMQG